MRLSQSQFATANSFGESLQNWVTDLTIIRSLFPSSPIPLPSFHGHRRLSRPRGDRVAGSSPRIPVTGGGTQPWRGLGRALAAHLHNDFFGAGWPVFVGRERERGPEAEGRVATMRKT